MAGQKAFDFSVLGLNPKVDRVTLFLGNGDKVLAWGWGETQTGRLRILAAGQKFDAADAHAREIAWYQVVAAGAIKFVSYKRRRDEWKKELDGVVDMGEKEDFSKGFV